MPKTNSVASGEAPITLRRRNLQLVHVVTLLLILALVGAVTAFVLYTRSQQQLKDVQKQLADFKSDPNAVVKEESQQLVDKVGLLVVLPADEQPTIATVTDLSKLQDQPFFASAQVGDKVLIYTNAKKAILYRPSTNRIIEIAPLNLGQQTTGVNSNASVTPSNSNTSTKIKQSNTNVNTAQ